MTKVFIDGSAGTTGLRIYDRLAKRSDITLLSLSDELRKNEAARKEMLNACDIAFLCLPDAAAIQAVSMIENPQTVVIDTSTAHRTNPEWTYGFPEILPDENAISQAKRIANPGCHASGFIALVAPLVKQGILDAASQLTCFSLTGYSGGGKSMIAQYETAGFGEGTATGAGVGAAQGAAAAPGASAQGASAEQALLEAPRVYGLSQQHKHLPEMVAMCALEHAPIFCPTVAPFYAGMEVCVPVFASQLTASYTNAENAKQAIEQAYREFYSKGFVHFVPEEQAAEQGFLSAAAFTGRDDMQVSVCGNGERLLLVARFDNLGKGSSGAAIQNMNLVLGVNPALGLNV